jgi:hypothetical protein
MIIENNKIYRGSAPNTVSTFFPKKSTKKAAPEKSPGVPLGRASVKFNNSSEASSDTLNFFTLGPRRSTEIFLMGPDRKNEPLVMFTLNTFRGESPVNGQVIWDKITMNKHPRYQCHNMSLPIAPFPKGQRGRSGGGGGLREY